MNPDGKADVKVHVPVPPAVQDLAREASGGAAATRVSGGGAAHETAEATAAPHLSSRFPISRAELPHFASMSVMMFLFIYIFTTVRDTKDTLVVSHCGAEAIPFLKLYAVMPCAAAFIVGYGRLSNALGKRALFHATLLPFVAFYLAFAFVLFPHRGRLHFPAATGAAVVAGPRGAAMSLLRYWSFSLFFVVSELWASAGVPLLFWQVSGGRGGGGGRGAARPRCSYTRPNTITRLHVSDSTFFAECARLGRTQAM